MNRAHKNLKAILNTEAQRTQRKHFFSVSSVPLCFKKALIFLWIVLFSCSGFAGEVNTYLSKDKIGLNESFSLVFTTLKKIQEKPDFSLLEDDFEILSISSGFNASIINHIVKEEASWTAILMPKREGKLLIPALRFGSDYSSQKTIEVTPFDSLKQDEAIFLETSIDPKTVIYEETALKLTIRLYSSLQIGQGTLSEPKLNDPDAFFEQIGQDRQYEITHQNGKRYAVVERRYVIVPRNAGSLEISPIIFEGSVIRGGRSFFNTQMDFKRVFSKSENIQVLKPAMQFENPWMTANEVHLVEDWPTKSSELMMGEPITRTITIKAEGALGSQIPDISLQLPKEIKHYVDKSEITNEFDKDRFIGIKQMKVALIPTQAGEFTLPEIALQWWDLKTNAPKKTVIPAKKIQVVGGEIAMNEPLEEKTLTINEKGEKFESNILKNTVLTTLFLLIIASICILLRKKKLPIDSLKNLKKELKKACLNNDAKHAEEYFLLIASKFFKEVKPLNLITIKPYLQENLSSAVFELYQALYGVKNQWEGKKLWKAFSSFKPPKQTYKEKIERELHPLYPQGEQ